MVSSPTSPAILPTRSETAPFGRSASATLCFWEAIMTKNDYLRLLVEEMHSAAVATIDKDGHPQLRIIDMMLWDEQGVYFLTARGKAFYEQLAGAGLYRAHRCP